MNEGERMSAILSESGVSDAPKAALSAGALLKQARQAKGLHIAALSVQLKVPQSKLEALEADRYQALPDATFARALATAMCRVLKVDAAPVLALLPPSSGGSLERVSYGLNQPFRERPTQDEGMSFDAFKRPVVWGPLLLLLAALLIYLLPERWTAFGGAAPAVSEASSPLLPLDLPASQAAAQPPLTAVTPAVAASVAVVQPLLTVPPAPPSAPPSGVAVSAQPGMAPVRLRASAETWVELTDARGQVVYSKLMRAEEQAELELALPARLRVGNVAGTELTLRGVPFDLLARSKDNVARIELN
jgi:cytoskeleton protein RodZ